MRSESKFNHAQVITAGSMWRHLNNGGRDFRMPGSISGRHPGRTSTALQHYSFATLPSRPYQAATRHFANLYQRDKAFAEALTEGRRYVSHHQLQVTHIETDFDMRVRHFLDDRKASAAVSNAMLPCPPPLLSGSTMNVKPCSAAILQVFLSPLTICARGHFRERPSPRRACSDRSYDGCPRPRYAGAFQACPLLNLQHLILFLLGRSCPGEIRRVGSQ